MAWPKEYDDEAVDRSAVQWLQIDAAGSGAGDLMDWGRIWDDQAPAGADPYWYYLPSLAVDSLNNMIVGFNASKSTEYIGALYQGRKSGDPKLLTSSKRSRNRRYARKQNIDHYCSP